MSICIAPMHETSLKLSLSLSLSLRFSRWTWVSRYQNVSILDYIGAKNDGSGGDNWSYKTCKAPVKSSPSTNQYPVFLQAGCPSCHPTNSVKTLKGSDITVLPSIPAFNLQASAFAFPAAADTHLPTHETETF